MAASAMFAELPNGLQIQPFTGPIRGQVILPGSKSITNRALLLAALSKQQVTLQGALFSEDSLIMARALEKLGFTISSDLNQRSFTIQGAAGQIPNAQANIYVGTAGTAARFLPAVCALHPNGVYYFDGSAAMRLRPMKGLLEALAAQGCTFDFEGEAWQLPFTMKTCGLKGGNIKIDASSSSQGLSALLMVAPLAKAPCKIQLSSTIVSEPFVEMTLAMMHSFGAKPSSKNDLFEVPLSGAYQPDSLYAIEPDATAASYFCALVAIHGGTLDLPGLKLRSLQGDAEFIELLRPLGLDCDRIENTWQLRGAGIKKLNTHQRLNMNRISDTFLTLAALAPLLGSAITLEGLAHTRSQESDRIAAMEEGLEQLGQSVKITADSIEIAPAPLRAATIRSHNDHRVAMSFGVLGTFNLYGNGKAWLQIDQPMCCQKTFPDFFEILENLRCPTLS
ncbi:MAG: 3-phosphoshikimate 1-carboxyvinyltransferase [Verrucomicrobia bacterium 21-51-4]|nr:MAG: 3-phosphoshikimate 1-carboxyvinyltransferase [Verrucomicrobia bacterium 21-51-4]HQU09089.1 3-phosphoshikimate 1-carboxyvinyltransferase [Opitutales bacterium]